MIDKYTDDDTISNFIDVGCGAGGMACSLNLKYGFTGTGTDFSETAIEAAKNLQSQLGITDIEFKLSSKNTTTKKHDLVTCFEVLEHVEDDVALFEYLTKISKKYIIISVPAHQKLFDKSDDLAGHFRRYDRIDLEKLIQHKGFEVTRFISYSYPYTNILKRVREIVIRLKKTSTDNADKIQQSKKSGVDLMGINRIIGMAHDWPYKPFHFLSIPFQKTNLGEGYLVLLTKKDNE